MSERPSYPGDGLWSQYRCVVHEFIAGQESCRDSELDPCLAREQREKKSGGKRRQIRRRFHPYVQISPAPILRRNERSLHPVHKV
jgi:hypothetical protein